MRKKYRLLTGTDDAEFCQKISDALDDGYVLYGSPIMTSHGADIIVGQAVILPDENQLSAGVKSNLTQAPASIVKS